MKYGIWNMTGYDRSSAERLAASGINPLTACVLCSRGYDTPEKAYSFLHPTDVLLNPMDLKGMPEAAARVREAIGAGEKIAVFGDYDVDGITATCLLTDFLRWQGADCVSYIPGRLEEGYGLNESAIRFLASRDVSLIITVDCGITAVNEARLCREFGIALVVTDHHECKQELPQADAVVDPRQKNCTYGNPSLAGVGVAFKLAAAIHGNQAAMLERYCDLVCLGTIADVMPLVGENRTFVRTGLNALQNPKRVGIRALMHECGCDRHPVTASTISYMLAPRINAAGRLGQVDIALDLFLTSNEAAAARLAAQLCELNHCRQSIEAEIYADAVSKLGGIDEPKAIVMASDTWHQGVVGIVASRLAEDYLCPVFLICLDGGKGKASSRSYGGFHLFSSLASLSDLLENYGGHDLAAGFTIRREKIDAFRDAITKMASDFYAGGEQQQALDIDCEVPCELFTVSNVDRLDDLEPCGSACPKPVFYMGGLKVEQLSEVGGNRHLKLKLRKGPFTVHAIFFSQTALRCGIGEGDEVEIAFTPQINEFRGTRSVQFNLVDIRPTALHREQAHRENLLYLRFAAEEAISAEEARQLYPVRKDFVLVWKYLSEHARDGLFEDDLASFSRKLSRTAGYPIGLMRTRICLDVFQERGLLDLRKTRREILIRLQNPGHKVNLDDSSIMLHLLELAGGDYPWNP